MAVSKPGGGGGSPPPELTPRGLPQPVVAPSLQGVLLPAAWGALQALQRA